jgi:hypothetical protein
MMLALRTGTSQFRFKLVLPYLRSSRTLKGTRPVVGNSHEREGQMIDFACPRCGNPLSVPDSLAGQKEECPRCSVFVSVPKDDSVFEEAQLQEGESAIPIEASTVPQPASDSYSCPGCGSGQTQRVAVAWETGTSSVTSSTTGVGLAAAGDDLIPIVTSMGSHGTQQTELARRISPPVRRGHSLPLVFFGGSVLSFVLIAVFLVFDKCSAPAVICCLLLGVLFTVCVEVILNSREKRYNRTVWATKYSRWKLLWICHRCGNVFLPEPQPR